MKPARPIQEGKTVKCPKCGNPFKASAEEPSASPRTPAAVKTSAQSESKPKPQAAPVAAQSTQEEGGGTYAVLKDPDEEAQQAAEEEARKKKQKRRKKEDREEEEDEDEEEEDEEEDKDKKGDVVEMYLKSLRTKDPRGLAQAAVVTPTNTLLRIALLGFFGWLITLVYFMIPIAFPRIEKEEDEYTQKTKGPEKDPKKKAETKEWSLFEQMQDKKDSSYPWLMVLFLFLMLLAMAQAGLIAQGAVKMQALESHNWARVSCILAIIPLHTIPIFWFLWSALELFDLFPNPFIFPAFLFLAGPAVGFMSLLTVNSPKVKAGFEYKPE
jgi:hypothetical protein